MVHNTHTDVHETTARHEHLQIALARRAPLQIENLRDLPRRIERFCALIERRRSEASNFQRTNELPDRHLINWLVLPKLKSKPWLNQLHCTRTAVESIGKLPLRNAFDVFNTLNYAARLHRMQLV